MLLKVNVQLLVLMLFISLILCWFLLQLSGLWWKHWDRESNDELLVQRRLSKLGCFLFLEHHFCPNLPVALLCIKMDRFWRRGGWGGGQRRRSSVTFCCLFLFLNHPDVFFSESILMMVKDWSSDSLECLVLPPTGHYYTEKDSGTKTLQEVYQQDFLKSTFKMYL